MIYLCGVIRFSHLLKRTTHDRTSPHIAPCNCRLKGGPTGLFPAFFNTVLNGDGMLYWPYLKDSFVALHRFVACCDVIAVK